MITICILRCNVCGAPMYPNPSKQAFCCAFCGNVTDYGSQLPRMQDGCVCQPERGRALL